MTTTRRGGGLCLGDDLHVYVCVCVRLTVHFRRKLTIGAVELFRIYLKILDFGTFSKRDARFVLAWTAGQRTSQRA